jgi:SAM-dependent methyltransferase
MAVWEPRRYGSDEVVLSPRLGPSDRPWIRLSSGQLAARERVVQRLADGTYAVEDAACFCRGAELDLTIAERDRYGLPVRTVLCRHCGLLRTTPRMTAAATAQFYAEDYRDLYTGPGNAEALFASQVARGHDLVKLLAPLLPTVESVYEVGCGAGGLLAPMHALGKRVAGVDYNGDWLATGRERGLDLVQGDALDLLEHRGEPADLVLFMHVLEHELDLRDGIAKVAALVRPGGLLLVEVPGVDAIGLGYGGDVLRYLQNAHTFHFTAVTLSFVLANCGLEVLACTDAAVALCRRPEHDPSANGPPPPAGEAGRVLRRLAAFERDFLRKHAA